MGTRRACKPFLKTLFIFCFFLLAQQVATLLAQTEGYLEHREGGGWVTAIGGRPAGAGLTAVFYSDGHELSIHYCYAVMGALEAIIIIPGAGFFIFYQSE